MNLLKLMKLAGKVQRLIELPERERQQYIRSCELRGLSREQAGKALEAMKETLLHG